MHTVGALLLLIDTSTLAIFDATSSQLSQCLSLARSRTNHDPLVTNKLRSQWAAASKRCDF